MKTLPVLLVFCAAEAFSQTQQYRLVPSADSRMELLVTKTGFLKGKQHRFVFEQYEGAVSYDGRNPPASRVTLNIESRSASCKDTWVSAKDLKKIQEFALKDMLDVERHPKISFTSTTINEISAGKFEAAGNLTIRGIVKPVVVSVAVASAAAGELLFEGTAQIRMTDYGLKPPTALLGTIGTRDEMSFSFLIKAHPAH